MTIKITPVNEMIGDLIPQPSYGTATSAGLDLHACIDRPVELKAGEVKLIPTGVKIECSGDMDVAGMLLPRSGLGHKGIVLGNLVGLIDSDYEGEIQISCWNRSSEPYTVEIGVKIAQLVFTPIVRVPVEIGPSREVRGAGGFGSTGR